jgi:ubiquinone/menaquinone biosynthesis C-methylase UbiE
MKESTINTTIYQGFIEMLGNVDGHKILSVSCGSGNYEAMIMKKFGNVEIVSTDIVDDLLIDQNKNYLEKSCRWEFKKTEPEKNLPFADNSFDLVFNTDVIEHVEKPTFFLSEQYRVLKKGGKIIVGTPNLLRIFNIAKLLTGRLSFPKKLCEGDIYTCYHHTQEFTEWNISGMLKEIGFIDIKIKNCFFGISPLNLTFFKFPQNGIGKLLSHYLLVNAKKR